MTTGAFPALFFGLKTGKKQIRSSSKDARADCLNAFDRLGRRTFLQTAPDALCVLSFPLLHNPCIMTADFDGSSYLLTFYTARTLFSFINVLRGFRKWKKNMPKDSFVQEKKITIEPQLVSPTENKLEKKV